MFDLVRWIRARILRWEVHILCLGSDREITGAVTKQAMFDMYKASKEDDMLMNVPRNHL